MSEKRCQTIGCSNTADGTLTYTLKGERMSDEVCADCAGFYTRRPALGATFVEYPRAITPDTVHAALSASGGNLGATKCYPQDGYPMVCIAATKSGRTLTLVDLDTVSTRTGHSPDHFDGPFPVWTHHYTDDERRTMRREGTVRATWSPKRGRYTINGTPVAVGTATYHRNFSY